jgi:DnaK suppressor protein
MDADLGVGTSAELDPRTLGNSHREDKTARIIGVLADEVGTPWGCGGHLRFGTEELSELAQGEIGSPATMAQHLTRDQLKRFEERLQRERARLLGLTRAPATPAEMPGLADPSDAADIAEEQVERSTRNTLSETERAQLAQVDRALSKLRAGTYGLSDVTGDPIPVPRLEALPWATTNVEDASGQR